MTIEIIAEVAQGYEGDAKLAELLALGAVRSGADAVKYQLVFADELCVPSYQYYDLFKSLEMEQSVWESTTEIIQSNKKKVYFDIYGEKSLDLAIELNAYGVKVSTTDFYNTPLIKSAIENFNKVFISVGGVPIDDVDKLFDEIKPVEHQVTLMYGFQAEPTPIEENNLLRIPELLSRYPNLSVGFMDHSSGESDEALYLPLMAVSLGVSYIEKHLTLDPILQIEDYISALEPQRFEKFVNLMKTMELALGISSFDITEKEQVYKNLAGKVVVSKRDIKMGEILQEKDLVLKRVSTDGSPNSFRQINELLGKKIENDILYNSPITKEMV
jgi:N,N'-diacetyllegionaminate synthase